MNKNIKKIMVTTMASAMSMGIFASSVLADEITIQNPIVYQGKTGEIEDNSTLLGLLTNDEEDSVFLQASAILDSGTCGDNAVWTLDQNGVLRISGAGDIDSYVFSSFELEDEEYASLRDMKEVIIGDGITSIGSYSFDGLKELKRVYISSTVRSMGAEPFNSCENLETIEVDPANPYFDSRNRCNSIIDSETDELLTGSNGSFVPNGVTSIGSHAFTSAGNIRELVLPDSVSYIGYQAFIHCETLENITIPESVNYISGDVFNRNGFVISGASGSYAQKYAEEYGYSFCDLSTGELMVHTVSQGACGENLNYELRSDGLLKITGSGDMYDYGFNEESPAWVYHNSGDWNAVSRVELPDGITRIGDNAFSGCYNLREVMIPDGVTSIGQWAFDCCERIEKVIVPASVKEIADSAFYNFYYDGIPEYLTIYGYNGTAAEEYANENEIPFVALGEIKVSEVALSKIALNKTSVTLKKGETGTLKVSYFPVNTTDSKITTWISSNKKVATVDANGNVTAKEAGTVTITAKCGTCQATCKVTVPKNVALKKITLNKTKASIRAGKTLILKVKYNPTNTTVDKKITWSSSNKKIATVDKNGKVSGKKAGTVTITAKCGSKKAVCKITVKKPIALKSISLNKAKASLQVGQTLSLKMNYKPTNTTVDKTIQWSSSNKAIATVNKNGKVSAKKAGKVTITAKCGNKKATCTITVRKVSGSVSTKTTIASQEGYQDFSVAYTERTKFL